MSVFLMIVRAYLWLIIFWIAVGIIVATAAYAVDLWARITIIGKDDETL